MKVRKVNRNGSITYELEIGTVRYVMTERDAIFLSSAISTLVLRNVTGYNVLVSSGTTSSTFVSEDEEE